MRLIPDPNLRLRQADWSQSDLDFLAYLAAGPVVEIGSDTFRVKLAADLQATLFRRLSGSVAGGYPGSVHPTDVETPLQQQHEIDGLIALAVKAGIVF